MSLQPSSLPDMKRIVFFLLCCYVYTNTCKAQDTVIKTDMTTIKCKIFEITESHIKYKKWENPNGPLYNLVQKEVQMIVYEDGTVEKFNSAEKSTSDKNDPQNLLRYSTPENLSEFNPDAETGIVSVDTTINYQTMRIRYKPSRIMVGTHSPLEFGVEQEYRIVKNLFNIGFLYSMPMPTDYISFAQNSFLYGSLYLPVNRVSGNYRSQDKGLFLYGHFGYKYFSAKLKDSWGLYTIPISSGNFTYRVGFDYLFGIFGISASTYEFKIHQVGLVFSIL